MPFFSIVIPTRNRPSLLANAVASVLEQDFPDFEVIVSDNSDQAQPENTRQCLHDTSRDKRLRYVRPDSVLPMTEHWEWAVGHSRGLYTGLLTDRSVYRLYALKTVHRHCERGANAVVSFLSDNISGDAAPFRMKVRPIARNWQIVKADEMLREFSNCTFSKRSPRMLNSFCRTELLQTLVRQYGSVFSGFAPDYSFCFHILDTVDEFLSLDARLVMSTNESQSNGIAFQKNQTNNARNEFLNDMDRRSEWSKYGPIFGHQDIIPNAILREYEIARSRQLSGRLVPIDYHTFYVKAFAGLVELAAQGFDQNRTFTKLEEFRLCHQFKREALPHVRRFRAKLRKWRGVARERILRAFSCLVLAVRKPHIGRPIIKLGQWCTFHTIVSALRYDSKFNGRFHDQLSGSSLP